MAIKHTGDIAPHRLSPEQLSCEFTDIAPLLDPAAAAVAASRCHYCYDAPCIEACPTQIDIPSFIRKIGNGNLKGAAVDILSANPLGGMCCAGLPDRDPLRRCLRAQPSGRKTGSDRRAAASCDRLGDGSRRGVVQARSRYGPSRRGGRRGAGRPRVCASPRAGRPSRDDLRRPRRRQAASTNTALRRTRRSTISRSVRWHGCARWAALKLKTVWRSDAT